MKAIIRFLFPLVGYFATATVITLALGLGYLWQTEKLTDERMFRLVALLQGIDLQQLAEAQRASIESVPPEEASVDAVVGQEQVSERNFEVKLLALQRGRLEFDHRLQQLKEQSERYDRLAREWQDRLRQQEVLTTQENVIKVVGDLEQLKPAMAKEQLMRWFEEGRKTDVITLLGRMTENKKKKILQSFATPEEQDKLFEIHQMMVDQAADKEKLSQALGELKSVDQSAP